MTSDGIARATTGARMPGGRPIRLRRIVWTLAVLALTAGLAAVWTLVARRQLAAAVVEESTAHLDQAYRAFEDFRTRSQANLKAICRVLVEDPRLKSTLATEGMDAATVADILNDLGKLRGAGFLLVLTPEGRVFAEAGAPELRGLDLSASSVVKSARESPEAVVGSWVLDKRVMDLGMMVIRYDEAIIAYLVVGQSVEQEVLRGIADRTGVEVASALADTVVLASSPDAGMKPVFARVAGQAGGFRGRLLSAGGKTYVTGVVELSAAAAQPHRLVLVRSLGGAMAPFERLRWWILTPPLLVLVSVMFATSGTRVFRRT